jgi:hypothetical protein
MTRPNPLLFGLYRRAIQLYPARLRILYQDQMLQTVRDADAERTYSAAFFWLYLFADFFKSAIKEHMLMIRNQIIARPVFFHTAALAIILTVWGFAAAITFQQLLRRGADQPQIQMAENYSSRIARIAKTLPGGLAAYRLPIDRIDASSSLESFVILYDAEGKALHSTGYINGAVPLPPAGVFAYLRTHPTDKFTWQPQSGLRIAAVAQRIDGPQPGFILVGRSLAVVQQQENQLRRGTFITWLSLMALLIFGAILLNHVQNASPTRSTSN